MKNTISVSGLIIAGCVSVNVYASDITDTYSAGDTLTATHMDNIKNAVNDNNSRISAIESASGYVSVPASAFHPTSTSYGCDYTNGYRFVMLSGISCGGTTRAYVYAPVSIPHGATITQLDCSIYDNSVDALFLDVIFRSVELSTGTMAVEFSALDSSTSVGNEILTSGSVNYVVDNSIKSYSIFVAIENSGTDFSAITTDVILYGCSVSYTM